MGFNLTAFGGGFAGALVEDIQQEEKLATLRGAQGVENMKANYKKTIEDNGKIKNELQSNIKILEGYDDTATQAELAAIASNKHIMDRIMSHVKDKEFDPTGFKISNLVKVAGDNSTATALERLSSMFTMQQQAAKATEEPKIGTGNIFTDITRSAGTRAEERSARETAKAMGVTLEQLKAAQDFKRPEAPDFGAKYDMTALQKQPSNAKDIKDKLEVQEIQAAQKFGENSPERLAAKKKKDFVENLEVKVDKNQDARAERLMLEKLDTKDPVRIKEIDVALKGIRESIKNHKKLTTIADPKEKEATYNAMKTDVSDYVNTRMRDAKGTKWRNMVEFKTFTDEATGKTTISKTNKVDMTPEQQQEMFAAERKLTAQALRDNGYVLPDGTPRTPVAERLMRNFNITANDLVVGASPPVATEQPLPMANAPTAQPATPQGKAPPQQAIDLLKANPSIAADFDKKYGPGAAKKYLGK